jgi:hypothetical protein
MAGGTGGGFRITRAGSLTRLSASHSLAPLYGAFICAVRSSERFRRRSRVQVQTGQTQGGGLWQSATPSRSRKLS